MPLAGCEQQQRLCPVMARQKARIAFFGLRFVGGKSSTSTRFAEAMRMEPGCVSEITKAEKDIFEQKNKL